MFPVLRTCGRSLFQSQCCSKPLPTNNEIGGCLTFVSRTFNRKALKGKTGLHRSKPEPANDASSGPSVGRLLIKPALFTVTTCACAFTGAAIYKYEEYVSQHNRKFHNQSDLSSRFFRFLEGSGEDKLEWRRTMSRYWSRFSAGEKMAVGCIFINACVFAGWKINNPVVAHMMHRFFTANVWGQSPCLSMLLSTFSHVNFTHLLVNMVCLWSFAPTVVNMLGKEQATAAYISAGMASAMASYVLNVIRAGTAVSVGASGAILGLAGIVCTQYPDAKLAIIFLPMYPIAAKYALGGLIAMDTAGVLLRCKFFDHAGHLGGTIFGVGYVMLGHQYVLKFQKQFLSWWDENR